MEITATSTSHENLIENRQHLLVVNKTHSRFTLVDAIFFYMPMHPLQLTHSRQYVETSD